MLHDYIAQCCRDVLVVDVDDFGLSMDFFIVFFLLSLHTIYIFVIPI